MAEALTFEKVWDMFQETDRRMKETDRQIKETALQIKETDLQMKETDRQMKETGLKIRETDRQIERVSRQMGELHNRFGEMAEHMVAPGIVKRFNELGFHFTQIATKGADIIENGKIKAQVDLVLENGEYIIAVEVKARVVEKDIEHHIRRLEILREYKEKMQEKRKIIYGAIAGAIFGPTEKKAALNAGLYVLVQSGDTMMIDLPDGFKPCEW